MTIHQIESISEGFIVRQHGDGTAVLSCFALDGCELARKVFPGNAFVTVCPMAPKVLVETPGSRAFCCALPGLDPVWDVPSSAFDDSREFRGQRRLFVDPETVVFVDPRSEIYREIRQGGWREIHGARPIWRTPHGELHVVTTGVWGLVGLTTKGKSVHPFKTRGCDLIAVSETRALLANAFDGIWWIDMVRGCVEKICSVTDSMVISSFGYSPETLAYSAFDINTGANEAPVITVDLATGKKARHFHIAGPGVGTVSWCGRYFISGHERSIRRVSDESIVGFFRLKDG